jgi:hypothetical protein
MGLKPRGVERDTVRQTSPRPHNTVQVERKTAHCPAGETAAELEAAAPRRSLKVKITARHGGPSPR